MTTDPQTEIARLKTRITDLLNQIEDHDIAEQNWRDRENALLAEQKRLQARSRHAEPLAQALIGMLNIKHGSEVATAKQALDAYRRECPQ